MDTAAPPQARAVSAEHRAVMEEMEELRKECERLEQLVWERERARDLTTNISRRSTAGGDEEIQVASVSAPPPIILVSPRQQQRQQQSPTTMLRSMSRCPSLGGIFLTAPSHCWRRCLAWPLLFAS